MMSSLNWGRTRRLLGMRILTTASEDLAPVTDVDFDSNTGVITALLLAAGAIGGNRLIGIG